MESEIMIDIARKEVHLIYLVAIIGMVFLLFVYTWVLHQIAQDNFITKAFLKAITLANLSDALCLYYTKKLLERYKAKFKEKEGNISLLEYRTFMRLILFEMYFNGGMDVISEKEDDELKTNMEFYSSRMSNYYIHKYFEANGITLNL